MTIKEAQFDAWNLAEEKGFHEGYGDNERTDTLLRLCLVHTEVSEAAQEVKRHWKGHPTVEQREVFAEELADAAIRILDLAGCIGVDLEDAITAKMAKNWGRPMHYGTSVASI